MSDLISRQAAIELIKNYCENGCDIVEDNWCPSCQREKFVELLKAMPPVTPQPKIGEWEIMAYDLYMCSKCYSKFTHNFKFCPNCGAKMERLRNDNSREK